MLLVVLDTSNYMSGSPMRAVQKGCEEIGKRFFDGEGATPFDRLYFVTYNSNAYSRKLRNKADYDAAVNGLRAGGGTSFYAAFMEIKKIIERENSENSEQKNVFQAGIAGIKSALGMQPAGEKEKLQEVVTIFMTDGQDNFRDPNK